ncbi:MAG: ArsR/SmtB family transcription factor [Succinivibrionaceae bacterium]
MNFNEKLIVDACDCNIIHKDLVHKVKSSLALSDDYLQLATLFKMFGDPSRIKLLDVLRHSEMCVCDLASLLGITKSAVSHQLKSLRLCNLVKFRRVGQVVYYSLADDHVIQILELGFSHIKE